MFVNHVTTNSLSVYHTLFLNREIPYPGSFRYNCAQTREVADRIMLMQRG